MGKGSRSVGPWLRITHTYHTHSSPHFSVNKALGLGPTGLHRGVSAPVVRSLGSTSPGVFGFPSPLSWQLDFWITALVVRSLGFPSLSHGG